MALTKGVHHIALKAKGAEAFQYGKRKALRSLRTAVAVYPSLRS